MSFDPEKVREDIPLLAQENPPIYFDNACMTLKPRPVIQAITDYYEQNPVCAGRSTYKLAGRVGEQLARSRQALARFLGADSPDEIVFTRNTTEAINLAARGLTLAPGSTILTTDREHNSNLVPFQRLEAAGHRHETVPSTPDGRVDVDAFQQRLETQDVSLVSLVHMSNLDGYIAPVEAITEIAHDHDALVLLDGAQSAPHLPVDVSDLGADLFAMSVHKMMGPTGVGALWARPHILEDMAPLITGGSTIETTSLEDHVLLDPPGRFEAGLQDFAGLAAVEATIEYLENLGPADIHAHEERLSTRLADGMDALGFELLGARDARGNGIVSFQMDEIGIHQLAVLLEDKGEILVRAGLHCLDSWFGARDLEGSCRASLYAYNTQAEVDRFLGVAEEIRDAVARSAA